MKRESIRVQHLPEVLRWLLVQFANDSMSEDAKVPVASWLGTFAHSLVSHWPRCEEPFVRCVNRCREQALSGALLLDEIADLHGTPVRNLSAVRESTIDLIDQNTSKIRSLELSVVEIMRWSFLYLGWSITSIQTLIKTHPDLHDVRDHQDLQEMIHPFGRTVADLPATLTDDPIELGILLLRDASMAGIELAAGAHCDDLDQHLDNLRACSDEEEQSDA